MRTRRPVRERAMTTPHAVLTEISPARDRPRGGACDLRIIVAVDDVVIGAARRSHDKGADGEQHRVADKMKPAGALCACKAKPPPTGDKQQPGSDRSVGAHKAQIGPHRRRRMAHPIAGNCVRRHTGRNGHDVLLRAILVDGHRAVAPSVLTFMRPVSQTLRWSNGSYSSVRKTSFAARRRSRCLVFSTDLNAIQRGLRLMRSRHCPPINLSGRILFL